MRKSLFSRMIFQVHLWGGLALGIYAFLIGLTGSVLVFREEIVHVISPKPVMAESAGTVSMEEVRSRIQSQYPGWNVWSLQPPSEPGEAWSSYVLQRGQGRLVFADSQGKVIGEHNLRDTWFGLFERFHSNLLIPRGGRWLNGVFGLVLGLLSITGLILWWPSRGEWSSAFQIVRRSNWKGITYDLHRVGGAITFVFVLMFCITGAYFTWPAVYRNIAALIFDTKPKPGPAVVTTQGVRLPIDDLVASAQRAIPEAKLVRVLVPGDSQEAVTVVLGHGSERATSQIRVNPHNAQVLSIDDFRERRTGDNVVSWLGPLHTGHFGNIAVKVLWALAGLAIPALFVTGFIMWCNRVVGPRLRRTARQREEVFVRQ